jgi:hypothetical protein
VWGAWVIANVAGEVVGFGAAGALMALTATSLEAQGGLGAAIGGAALVIALP